MGSAEKLEAVEGIVERSRLWYRPDIMRSIRLYVVGRVIGDLAEAGYFPAEPRFQKVLSAFGWSHVISAKQLAKDIARFLANAKYIEQEEYLEGIRCDTINVEPGVFKILAGERLWEISTLSLYFVAVASYILGAGGLGYRYAYSRMKQLVCEVCVSGGPLEVEPADLASRLHENWMQKVRIIAAPESLLDTFDAEGAWRDARDANDLELAIRLEAVQIERSKGGRRIKSFAVGDNFMKLLAPCQTIGSERFSSVVRRKCGLLVANAPNFVINEPRISASNTAAVRVRQSDGAVAKGVHVTKSHEALRLMFCLREDGFIEFAKIAEKVDVDIEE